MPAEKPKISGTEFCLEKVYTEHIEKGEPLIHLQKKNY